MKVIVNEKQWHVFVFEENIEVEARIDGNYSVKVDGKSRPVNSLTGPQVKTMAAMLSRGMDKLTEVYRREQQKYPF